MRSVLWNRSILPVVVGECGLVRRCLMPFVAADLLEQHLHRQRFYVVSGELAAVVTQHLRWHPIAAHCRGEHLTDLLARCPGQHGGDDA